ncbi:DUF420 domain-containing protein [candidate division KSB1 bacterium]
MNSTDLPAINAFLNFMSTLFLLAGYIRIKKGYRETHKKLMLTALVLSAFFLVSYLIYHYNAGSVPYARYDWTRPVYFVILIPHIILAGINLPFIVVAVWFALHGRYDRHKKLVKWVYPAWIYVSVTGVIVYFMLYHLPPMV